MKKYSSDGLKNLSPWSNPKNPDILFPIESYEKLLKTLGYQEVSKWLEGWSIRGGANLAFSAWPRNIKSDWIWGIGLPFLSEIEHSITESKDSVLLGISGLPGCGKTSLGKWLEKACLELNWPLTVISLDDFYYSATQLNDAMEGNPWGVPRGLPGSHSIELLNQVLDHWSNTEEILAPQFDKSLRNGLGDRSGWRKTRTKILVIEGWFLGCEPIKNSSIIELAEKNIYPPLGTQERIYRKRIQHSLCEYNSIWSRFKRIWHLKSLDFNSTRNWKTEQEKNMGKLRGSSLKGKSLESFIRMIQASIPQESLMNINSDVIIEIDSLRQIRWVGVNEDK